MQPKILLYTTLIITMVSCKKIVAIDPPKSELVINTVFSSDAIAEQAIAGLYASLLAGYASGDLTSITYLAGLSSDELIPGSGGGIDFYNNAILSNNAVISTLWSDPYKEIYIANSILKGLNLQTTNISQTLRQQLSGEARFVRAFSYFCLINLFGDVPLTLTTDYNINENIARTSKEVVYDQIITDLKDAQNLLSGDYIKNERVRANKWVATALLARVYLYRGQWSDAEIQASAVIGNNATFNFCPLDKVFLMNSNEAIWQLSRVDANSADAATFVISATNPVNATIRPSVVASFDPADKRKTSWITSRTYNGNTYYYPTKYKATEVTPVTEYTTILRLAEQYLIRAEARVWQGKLTVAASDISVLRRRAGLANITASTKEAMLAMIEKERVFELFTEWGHRWFDLKRSPSLTIAGNTRADDLLKPLEKSWQSTDTLYPIPLDQLLKDPAMANAQNPGY
ncbi:RagB/SusD family nutrient uptake outer membrane protein [Chitinophaga oryziterrae]|uniref:RagB/SusD family nutrient uptake outer membrane protein n=1 Tax=Chitinophaga oryziterrae TaxID=1031224 RepID=A0A6N8JBV5_9BACT|nr:RagB/SusD family nutrient uptake outer membrane protein [Chitinophaga oryziterrae]MVT42021.1 RagB/SusD family nutrient uptake outer membrane protein [Chitinophaga oryziterrae]